MWVDRTVPAVNHRFSHPASNQRLSLQNQLPVLTRKLSAVKSKLPVPVICVKGPYRSILHTGRLICTVNHGVVVINPLTSEIELIAGLNAAESVDENAGDGKGWVDGLGHYARFRNPRVVVVDSERCCYLSDLNTHTIRRVTLPATCFLSAPK